MRYPHTFLGLPVLPGFYSGLVSVDYLWQRNSRAVAASMPIMSLADYDLIHAGHMPTRNAMPADQASGRCCNGCSASNFSS